MLKKLKKYISILLTAAMLCTSASVLPDNVFEHIGGITVSAATSDYTFDPTTGTITGYSGAGGDVVIPDSIDGVPVKAIGKDAFMKCASLTKITMPDTVTSVGEYAFFNCSSLESVNLPSTLTTIGNLAFQDCSSLKEITIPAGVTSWGHQAFMGCTSLTRVTISEGVTSVGNLAFTYCNSLSSVTLPSTLTSIGGVAFGECTSLTEITIPEGVTAIEEQTFAGCRSLISVNLPDTLTSIGENAFGYCTSLTEITIPESVSVIDELAFTECTQLDNIIYPANTEVKAYEIPQDDLDRYLEVINNPDYPDDFRNQMQNELDKLRARKTIPETTTQVNYTVENGEVTITNIILGTGKTEVEIPETINGVPVTSVDESVRDKVSESGHTHKGGTASCTAKAVCDVCGQEYGELAEHSYSEKWQSDETNHWHECTVCHNDKKDTAAHTWGEGVETTPSTEDTEGVMTYTCTVCNATKTEPINKLPHTHQLVKTEEVPATCTAAGTSEYWTCSKCGNMFSDENGTVKITEIPSIPALGHSEEIIPEVPATCTAAGSTAGVKCSRCGTILTAPETIPATGHKYGTDWKSEGTGHWHECTVCGDRTGFAAHTEDSGTVAVKPTTETTGLRVYACTECGAKIRDEIITVLDPDHEHEYGADWKYNKENHWHECICGETNEMSPHVWDSGTPVTPPTCTEAGVMTYSCTVCGITKTELVNALGHSFTNYIFNNDATCTEDGTETAVCDRCSETSTRTAVGSKKGHTEDGGTITKQPTETETGVKTFHCTVCGAVLRAETIPAIVPEHTHVFGTTWNYDGTSHWHECTCGEKSDTASHISDGGTVTKQPTATETGTRTYKCTVCGYVMNTETIPATGEEHTHVFGTSWNYDSTSHWHECTCGEKSDTASHISDGGTVTKQPTATETGTRTYKCTVCGYVLNTETIPATGIPTTPVTPPYVPSNPTTSVTTPQTPSKEPFIQDDNGKTGWETISDTILNTSDGGTVTINMNDTTELPKDIVSQIKGRDIDLVLDMGSGFTWTINGMSVTKAKTVDMKVRKASKIPKSVIEEYFGDLETIQIDLSHNGDLGFAAELTVDLGSKYNGMYANSYCYKSRKFEFGDSAEISDGKAKLRFTHASSWLITITDVSVFEDVAAGAGVSADGDPIDFDRAALPGFIGVILILGVGFVYFKRARQK